MVIGGVNVARGGVPAYPALWAGNALLLTVGGLLLWRISRR
jgi:lipopolysaccharide export LptBFGC system permease protein LptF